MPTLPDTLHFLFSDAGGIPNNPRLPVVIYKRAFVGLAEDALADTLEARWKKNGWAAAWRWGVYDFPHYHSTAHEILGVFRGQASLRLGHSSGAVLAVEAGDVVVLPAGTGHQNLGSSPDFQVVGGYPQGQTADLLKGKPDERPAADQRIAAVPLPVKDPLFGPTGPLVDLWLSSSK
jgi:uncharacterized protein YjlB